MSLSKFLNKSSRITEIENDPTKDLHLLLEDEENPLLNDCFYYEPIQLKVKECGNYKLRILHLNIHSVPQKIDELIDLLDKLQQVNCSIDVLLLCETLITPKTNLARCNIPGYSLIEKHRSNTTGGGVAIYVSNKLKFTLEMIW